MKAIIADINKNKMVVIGDNGSFIATKARIGAKIGDEIIYSPSSLIVAFKSPAVRSLATAACILLFIQGGVFAYYLPDKYIDIDINPSVEIVTNHFNKVIKVEALNSDGIAIIENTDLVNQGYDNAVEKIVERAYEKNYLKKNESSSVMVTVSSNNSSQNDETNKILKAKVEKVNKVNNSPSTVETNSIPIVKYQQAKKQSVSPGKIILLERLQEVAPDATISDVKNHSVKDVLETIREKRKAIIEQQLKKNGNAAAPAQHPKVGVQKDNNSPIAPNIVPNTSSPKAVMPFRNPRPKPTPSSDRNNEQQNRIKRNNTNIETATTPPPVSEGVVPNPKNEMNNANKPPTAKRRQGNENPRKNGVLLPKQSQQ